ncbi:MAG: AAA family ATPase [Oscillospiraceae bacterium]|nr:AAA family ATPase [Oscillospiraceae bacterium]
MKKENNLSQYLTSVSDVQEKEIEWVIPKWIAKGGITLLVGDGGIGKTNLWCYLIARISGGLPTMLDDPDYESEVPPGMAATINYSNKTIYEHGPNRTCLYFSKEDSTATRLKEALDLYGSDTENIHTIEIEHLHGFNYASQDLKDIIEEQRPAICIFDPVQAFYPGGASMSSRQQSREALDHLIQLGQAYNTAFLLVCHTNKRKTDDWRERISGTADLPDIARSIIFTSYTELMPNHKMLYISNEKNSYAPLQETVLYTIREGGRITYAGTSEKRFAEYATSAPYKKAEEKAKSQKELCKEAILTALQEHEEMIVKELDDAITTLGFSSKMCRNAKEELIAEGMIARQCLSAQSEEDGRKGVKWILRPAEKTL